MRINRGSGSQEVVSRGVHRVSRPSSPVFCSQRWHLLGQPHTWLLAGSSTAGLLVVVCLGYLKAWEERLESSQASAVGQSVSRSVGQSFGQLVVEVNLGTPPRLLAQSDVAFFSLRASVVCDE